MSSYVLVTTALYVWNLYRVWQRVGPAIDRMRDGPGVLVASLTVMTVTVGPPLAMALWGSSLLLRPH